MTDDTRMDNDQFDHRLRQMAADYNAPPPTPREEIWAGIQARRLERPRRGRIRRFPVWQVVTGIAAVLAIGIALGRGTVRTSGTVPALATNDPGVELAAVSQVAYRVAASEHLSQVETFLTFFQTETRNGRLSESDYHRPARALLRQTRLLQDSPIAEDLALRTLLDDVELVLMQIGQYSSDRVEDLDFIDHGIEQRSVLLKLRSAVPAGPAHVASQGAL
ncbi:MAG TPA: hypothetical protein VGA37_11050 [Gemmatimonadales bacterium]